jgi:hypothetical protein
LRRLSPRASGRGARYVETRARRQRAGPPRRAALPAYEKSWPGWKFYPVRRIRGEKAEGFGLITVIPTEAERDRYYKADGSPSQLGKAANAKIQPIVDEMNKLGTITADPYIDWLVY